MEILHFLQNLQLEIQLVHIEVRSKSAYFC